MSQVRPLDDALLEVERAAREYAKHSHANLGKSKAYRAREEARDALLDALSRLDQLRERPFTNR